MKNTSSLARFLAVLALTAISLTAATCGKDDNNNPVYVAPAGTTITINPSSVDLKITGGACTGGVSYKDQMFTITLYDKSSTESNPQPMNGISMVINLDYSSNYSSTDVRAMQLYDVDPSSGNISPVTVPFTTATGNSGTKVVWVRMDVSCTYTGSLEVSAKSAYNNAEIKIEDK